MSTKFRLLYFVMLVSLCFLTSHWLWYLEVPPSFPVMKWKTAENGGESFWFDLVVNKNTSVLEELPATVVHPGGPFWLEQLQTIIGDNTADQRIEALSAILQFQLEELLEKADCSKLTLSCGHYNDCGLGCQLHHRAFCVLMSFTLGIPLIHDTSQWPFKSPWETHFKRLGSTCTINEKTVFVTFSPGVPISLRFSELCTGNKCVTNCTVLLSLNGSIPISRELFNLVGMLGHQNPFLWYAGQFIVYCLRFNKESAEMFQKLENTIEIGLNPPVVGIQARRTDKRQESTDSYHNESEYMEIAGKFFQDLEQHVGPKTIYIASEDHTVLLGMRSRYGLPEWRILGFESNVTLQDQGERASEYGLLSIVRDVYFLTKSDFLICGLSSNICRLILEVMATRFYDAESRCHSVDGGYIWALWNFNVWKLSPD